MDTLDKLLRQTKTTARDYDPNETMEQALCGNIEEDQIEHQGSERKIRIGQRWHRCEQEQWYKCYGFKSMEDFIEELGPRKRQVLQYGFKQVIKYISIRELPLALLKDTDLPLNLLAEIVARKKHGPELAALIKYAIQHHKLPKEPNKPGSRGSDPSDSDTPRRIAARVTTAVLALCKGICTLAERTEGRSLDTDWSHKLDDSIRGLITQWAAWRCITPGELAALASYERKLDRDPPETDERRTPSEGAADQQPESRPPESRPPAAEPQQEMWYNVVGRAVLAHLLPGEDELLSGYLLKALAGPRPVEFNAMCREVGKRMTDDRQREHLTAWLVLCGNWNYETRFIYLYNFMLIAQFPEWRLDLHSLRSLAESMPRSVLDSLEPAWRYYRLDGKPDGSPDVHDTWELGLSILRGVQERGYDVPILVAADAYVAVADAREELERQERAWAPQAAAAAAEQELGAGAAAG